ncbi:hypothetical protein [Rhodococcus sp. H29-C3]|uniref:hypothetical protein n=1 Tax=Rhodococcus sp. H29-C3 TaxID=3046307 RepID=UPI0024B90084|nr:hypothetical protein [Rhodococcus sp. H29-C3]MDJ0363388.1 hypothetical protein [Rhodococcus sp. H29-C3]
MKGRMKTAGTHSSKWSTVAVILSIVAAGTAVAGLLEDPATDIAGCEELVRSGQAQRIPSPSTYSKRSALLTASM